MGVEVVVVTSTTTTLSSISSSTSCLPWSCFVIMLTPVSRILLILLVSRIVPVRSSRVSRKALQKETAVEKAENLRKKSSSSSSSIATLHVPALVSLPHVSRARRAISCYPFFLPFFLLSVKSY